MKSWQGSRKGEMERGNKNLGNWMPHSETVKKAEGQKISRKLICRKEKKWWSLVTFKPEIDGWAPSEEKWGKGIRQITL